MARFLLGEKLLAVVIYPFWERRALTTTMTSGISGHFTSELFH
jgi:hypothetical protein